MGRRSYTAEHAAEAVRLVEERGIAVRQAVRELGKAINTLQACVKVSRTRDEARRDIFDRIERFYNPVRRHSTLGDVSPVMYEQGAVTYGHTVH